MRIKKGFNLHDVCGQQVIIAEGIENVDFNHLVTLNESSAFLFQKFHDMEFDAKTLADALCEEYEVDEATALRDSERLCQMWLDIGIAWC